MKKVIAQNTPEAKGPFSQAIIEGNLVFTSGQIPLTTDFKLVEGTVEEQVNQIMNNLKEVLEEAGSSLNKVIKTTVYITDMSIYGEFNEVYERYMTDPFPAREVVCVKELPLGAKIEISMVASIG